MDQRLQAIEDNYTAKISLAGQTNDTDLIFFYIDQKKKRKEAIAKTITQQHTKEEKKIVNIVTTYHLKEAALLKTNNEDEKEQLKREINSLQYDLIVHVRWYLISKTERTLPIMDIIDEKEFRQITDLFFEDDYTNNWIFDENLWLEKNYFIENEEEDTEEEKRESGEVTARVDTPFLNSIRWDIKETYRIWWWAIGKKIKENIEKFTKIFENKPKIFISVFAEWYTKEELKIIIQQYYQKEYYTDMLEKYIDDRYSEED